MISIVVVVEEEVIKLCTIFLEKYCINRYIKQKIKTRYIQIEKLCQSYIRKQFRIQLSG